MRRLVLSLVLALALAGCASSASGGTTPGTAHKPRSLGSGPVLAPAPAIAATASLTVKLLPRLGGSGTAVFSPYSIETALAMVDQGAAGTTATQIRHVLGGASAAALASSNYE